MNDKIKELISQSYDYAVVTTIDPFTQEVVTDYIDGTKTIFNKEKFAELIVRECVSLLPPRGDYYRLPVQASIKQHFGVEE